MNKINVFDFLEFRQKIIKDPLEYIPSLLRSREVYPVPYQITELFISSGPAVFVSFFWNNVFVSQLFRNSVDDLGITLYQSEFIIDVIIYQCVIISFVSPIITILCSHISAYVFKNRSLKRVSFSRNPRNQMLILHGSYGLFPGIIFSVYFVILSTVYISSEIIKSVNSNIEIYENTEFPSIIYDYMNRYINSIDGILISILGILFFFRILYLYLYKIPSIFSKVQKTKRKLYKFVINAVLLYLFFSTSVVLTLLVSSWAAFIFVSWRLSVG